jgi:hypothetical protein
MEEQKETPRCGLCRYGKLDGDEVQCTLHETIRVIYDICGDYERQQRAGLPEE